MKFFNKTNILLASAAVFLTAGLANAETVTKQTTVTQKDLPNTYQVNFAALDLNHDGLLSRQEVGRKLFYIFDTDGNEVVDNIEYGTPKVVTIVPLKATELTMIDFDDNGVPDVTKYNSDEFAKFSMLNRFDKDNDGLSAKEFMDTAFLQVDRDRNGTIDISEWREEYVQSMSPLSAKQYRYND